MLAFRTLDLQAEKHVRDSSAPIAMAVWAAAFSCVVLIQGGSAPAEKPGTNEPGTNEPGTRRQIRDRPRSLGGSPENRNRRAGRSLLDTHQANRLDMIDHRLRGSLEAVFGSWSDRDHRMIGKIENWSERSTRKGRGLAESPPIEAVTTAPRFTPSDPRLPSARTRRSSPHPRG